MRFLADESCDFSVVKALRSAGHDVTTAGDTLRGAADRLVLDTALREQRVLLTEDKDFGELVFATAAATTGVVLLRYSYPARSKLVRQVVEVVAARGVELVGSFVVIRPSGTRVRRLSTHSIVPMG